MLQRLAQSAPAGNSHLARPLVSVAPGPCSQIFSQPHPRNDLSIARYWRYLPSLFALLGLILCISSEVHALQIELEGVPKKLRPGMRATLETPVDDSQESIAEFTNLVPERARLALESEGYYNSDVTLRQDADTLFVTVALGPAVKITTLIIQVEGDGLSLIHI